MIPGGGVENMTVVNTAVAVFIPALFGLIGSIWRPKNYRKLALEDIHIIRNLESLEDAPGDALSQAKMQLCSDLSSLRQQSNQKMARATYWALTMTIGMGVSFLLMYLIRGLLSDDWSGHWLALSALIYWPMVALLWLIVLVRKLSDFSE
jgi:hypothetical protein